MKTYPQNALRARSGMVSSPDPLVDFLYELMRDHLPPGKIEEILLHGPVRDESMTFTNGWLAQYARDVANRLTGKQDKYETVPVQ